MVAGGERLTASHDLAKRRSSAEWQRALEAAHFSTRVSPDFIARLSNKPQRGGDRLTGLPVDSGKNRRVIARELAESLKSNQGFAVISADLDNLKTANGVSRKFGDEMIKVGAATLCERLDALGLVGLEGVSVYVVRPSKAADETIIWLFGLNPDQMTQVTTMGAALNQQVRKFSDEAASYDFSNSATVITSNDEFFQTEIDSTRAWLTTGAGRRRLPWNLFNHMTDYADDRTKLEKVTKDIKRLPVEQMVETLDLTQGAEKVEVMMRLLGNILGDTRISTPLLLASYRMIENEVRMEGLNPVEILNRMSQAMGINVTTFARLNYTLNDIRVAFLDHILHQEYTAAGFTDH